MIYEYPNCPSYCKICKNYYGEVVCLQCKDDRIKVGSICICKDKTLFDDGEGNCIERPIFVKGEIDDTLLAYINFYLDSGKSQYKDSSFNNVKVLWKGVKVNSEK